MRAQIEQLDALGQKPGDEVQERVRSKKRIRDHIAALEGLMYPPDEDAPPDEDDADG